MIWLYPPASFYYYTPIYIPALDERVMPFRQSEQVQQIQPPYLQTWPYSNNYYGNYYES
ncbi:hypothetical protein [Bacillus sp. OTU530]|uniref:hypothetical protein n=1 Tax=Bacillus sp. OTU530 TaxID=3043862 RepID=UPI00313D1B29